MLVLPSESLIENGQVTVNQIICNDTIRSFVHFEQSKNLPEAEIKEKKIELKTILHTLEDPWSYYQGLNFIAEIYYLEYGMVGAYCIVKNLLTHIFGVYAQNPKEFTDALTKRMEYTYAILLKEVPDFDEIINFDTAEAATDGAMQRLNFTVSWFLTLLAYRLSDHQRALSLFDYCLCSLHKFTSSFLVAAIVMTLLSNQGIDADSPKTDTMALFYNNRQNDIDLKAVLLKTTELLGKEEYIHEKLEKEVLKIRQKKGAAKVMGKFFGGLKGLFGKK